MYNDKLSIFLFELNQQKTLFLFLSLSLSLALFRSVYFDPYLAAAAAQADPNLRFQVRLIDYLYWIKEKTKIKKYK